MQTMVVNFRIQKQLNSMKRMIDVHTYTIVIPVLLIKKDPLKGIMNLYAAFFQKVLILRLIRRKISLS